MGAAPAQIAVLNDVFTPGQEEFDKAEAMLEAYRHATEVERKGAVMFGNEMIDEASRKMAEQLAARGRAAGLEVEKRWEDFQREMGVGMSIVELTEDQDAIVQAVREFVEQEVYPVAEELEHRDEFPEKIVQQMRDMGLFGLTVPEEYGGAEMDLMTYAWWWRAVAGLDVPLGRPEHTS